MQSSVGMKSVPADMVVFDELDEATPDAKTLARERLSHSDYRRMVELSNPSLPGYGIDEAYQESDQRHWTLRCEACDAWTALDAEFPRKLGDEVRIIRPRPDGTFYRACRRCGGELDLAQGEWVPDYPDRPVHGYRISQLISSKIDPGEILREYQRTRHPERFYNLKIGVAWADAQSVLSPSAVLALCGDRVMEETSEQPCTMGVDTGRDLHVVVSRWDGVRRRVVYVGVLQEYAQLDDLMKRFQVRRCVIDALPEIHITRAFAGRFPGRVWLNYFNEHQKGSYRWDEKERIVRENRTEALDASRRVIREGVVVLPRRTPLLEEFAAHLAADAKRLVEDEETGSQVYRYVKTGTNHFSFAFTYDCIAWSGERPGGGEAGVRVGILTDDEID
ncbi:MAG: phage terminase large subunit family protein, partial [Actinomycetota bacterium]